MAVIVLELPFMSINDYHRSIQMRGAGKRSTSNPEGWGARVLVSAEGREYKEQVQAMFRQQVGVFSPLEGDLALDIVWRRPRRIGDVDNVVKALQDALAGFAFVNDRQIADLRVRRDDRTPGNPGLTVTIRPLGDDLASASQGDLLADPLPQGGQGEIVAGAGEGAAGGALYEHHPTRWCAKPGPHRDCKAAKA